MTLSPFTAQSRLTVPQRLPLCLTTKLKLDAFLHMEKKAIFSYSRLLIEDLHYIPNCVRKKEWLNSQSQGQHPVKHSVYNVILIFAYIILPLWLGAVDSDHQLKKIWLSRKEKSLWDMPWSSIITSTS